MYSSQERTLFNGAQLSLVITRESTETGRKVLAPQTQILAQLLGHRSMNDDASTKYATYVIQQSRGLEYGIECGLVWVE
jgi:hypothetical protein